MSEPEALATDALETAQQTIEAAKDEGLVEQAMVERQAVADFAAMMATAILQGVPRSALSQYSSALSSETAHTNKTDIKDEVEREVEKASKGDADAQPLNAYLADRLDSITAVRSTDAKQSTLYRWEFDDPAAGAYQIETGNEIETDHYAWRQLRSAIFDVAGVWTTAPPDELADHDAWADFIGPLIKEQSVGVTTKGPRTTALESLQNYVHRTEAYADIEDMVSLGGLRIDDDPENGDPSEIWVPSTEISKICEDHSISERALQVELDAKGHTVGRIGGVSETTYVHGDKFTYWVLSANFADVGGYDPEPESSIERIDRMMQEDKDGSGDADDEPGLIGSTGPEEDAMLGDGGETDE